VGQRLEKLRLTFQLFSFLLLPLLIGGGDPPPYTTIPGGSSGVRRSGTPFWVFVSPAEWEGSGFWEGLDAIPARRRFRSEWLRGVSVDVEPAGADALRRLPGVVEVRPVGTLPVLPIKGLSYASSQPEDGSGRSGGLARPENPPLYPRGQEAADSAYGDLGPVLEILGVTQAHSLGYLGVGVRVGILDGTFLAEHATLRSHPPLAVRDFVDLDGSVEPGPSDPPGSASHGTALWSLVAADLPGTLRGGAPGVEVILARGRGLGGLTQADEDRWVAGLEWLESQGARIVVSGVGFREFPDKVYSIGDLDGNTTPATRAADQAASRGVLVVTPVGNGGPSPSSLEAPSDGDSVLAVGALDSRGIPAAISAIGPTGDGRPKPDLHAPGTGLQAASALDLQALERVTGTEFAGALLAGSSALLVEAYPDRGPMELLDMLRASAPPDTGAAVGPPNVASAIVFPQGVIPLPLDEVDGVGQLTNLAPQFRWAVPTLHPLGLPVTFHIELSEDPLFRQLTVSDSVVGTFARRLQEPLPPRKRLFWRIRARSVQGVERVTEIQDPFLVPPWIALDVLNEPGGSETVEPQPLFRWTPAQLLPPAGPFVFELQIVSDREGDVIQEYSGLDDPELRVPTPLPFNLPMRWKVVAASTGGMADTVTSAGPFVVTSGANPPATILYQNFPNPFPNPELGAHVTRIWFDLAERSPVELAVFDIRGRLVRRLIPGTGCPPTELMPGVYGREAGISGDPCQTFSWDGRDDQERLVPGGVYLLRLRAGGSTHVRRIVFRR